MNSAIERLLTLRVVDVMNSPAVAVDETTTMEDAARKLASHDVSGVPVVDSTGQCVGVLSVADYADGIHRADDIQLVQTDHGIRLSETENVDTVAQELVSDHMSPIVFTISSAAPIISAARAMCREHIHRLIIVDEDQRPTGVISSLDLVAALIAAVEE